MPPDVPPLITLDEAAALLRLPLTAVETAVHTGEIPVTAHDGHLYIDAHTLLADFGIWPGEPTSFRLTDTGARILDATAEDAS